MSEPKHYPPFAPSVFYIDPDGEFVAEWIYKDCRIVVATDGDNVYLLATGIENE